MFRRLAAVAVLASFASLTAMPSASAVGCPLPRWDQRPTGLYNPTTGNPIMICMPIYDAV